MSTTRRLLLENGDLFIETTTTTTTAASAGASPTEASTSTKSPFRLLAGSMHYFRIPPAYYSDRIWKCRQMGCNTVETYIAWNYHQPERDGGWKRLEELVQFVECVREAGLFLIVRMSPYICAEWDNGGLPYWLLTDRNVRLRSRHPTFMAAVYEFYNVMVTTLRPYFSSQPGGHIIACQLENEYGCTQTDLEYLRLQYDYLRNDLQVDLPMFNGVWPEERFLRNGHLPGTIATVNFSEHAAKNFDTMERSMAKIEPDIQQQPRICTELWIGWFTAWGGQRYKPKEPPHVIAGRLDEVLANQGHAILYMFHGGTNFAFFNGANIRTDYCSFTITSYDYEAPLNESGQVTELYTQLKAVLAKHGLTPQRQDAAIEASEDDVPPEPVPPPVSYESITATESADVLDQLQQLSTKPIVSPFPLTMEECHQDYGYLVYRTRIPGPTPPDVLELGGETLSINELRDRAQVFLNGEYLETMQRTGGRGVVVSKAKFVVPTVESAELTLVIENQGRANFAPFTQEYKGITESVFCGGCLCLSNWEHFCLPWTKKQLERVQWSSIMAQDRMDAPPKRRPTLFRAMWDLTQTMTALRDTYVHLPPPWIKGVVFVNGFNVGRYWNTQGPQQSLYCPATLLVPGEMNEIIIFEEEQAGRTIEFVDRLIIMDEQLKVVAMPQAES